MAYVVVIPSKARNLSDFKSHGGLKMHHYQLSRSLDAPTTMVLSYTFFVRSSDEGVVYVVSMERQVESARPISGNRVPRARSSAQLSRAHVDRGLASLSAGASRLLEARRVL
ncbi:MAG TPA: hypothetical protein VGK65_15880 [Candidatus Binatia bacterium]